MVTRTDSVIGGGLSPANAGAESEVSPDTLTILEETATLDKEVVTTGRVRVATQTRLVDEIATATLDGQEVEVTRVHIGKPVTGDLPQTRTEGDLTIVPVFEEVLVVEKRLMLKEELHIRRRTTTERVEVPVQLRKQEAEVQRSDV